MFLVTTTFLCVSGVNNLFYCQFNLGIPALDCLQQKIGNILIGSKIKQNFLLHGPGTLTL